MKAELHQRLDGAIAAGAGAVFVMALLAVGREGLETALFLWAGAQASGQTTTPLLGAVLGLGTAVDRGLGVLPRCADASTCGGSSPGRACS